MYRCRISRTSTTGFENGLEKSFNDVGITLRVTAASFDPCGWGQYYRHQSVGGPCMRPRNFASLFLCVAVLTVSSLGLNRGMVLHVDDHGHLALESAHVRHAHEHEEGADHEHNDFAGDADHAELHAAMAFDANAGVVKADQRTDSSALSAVADAAFLPHPLSSVLLPDLPSVIERTGTADFWVSTAHPELASLGTVVLLV